MSMPVSPIKRLSLHTRWFAMLSVLLVTATRLIYQLDKIPLWADEGWTIATTAEKSPVNIITDWVAVDVHPPLFFLDLWMWRQFTGDTIFEMRYFGVLLVLIGTAVMFQVGKTMFRSELAGVLGAFLFGVHDLVRVLTQEVRHYPQQQLMVALGLWFYWRFWEKPSRNRAIAFAFAGAGMVWVHYWGGFILMSMGLHTLITRRKNLTPYLLGFVGVGLLFAPWLPVIYHQMTIERPNGLPHALANNWEVYKTIVFQLVGVPEILWLGLALFGIIGATTTWKRPKIHSASGLVFLCVMLTLGLSILFNKFYATLSFRSLAVIIPPLSALIGYSITLFQSRERTVIISFVVLQSLLVMSAGPLPRAPWEEVADVLAKHSTQDEIILVELDTDEFAVEYYVDQLTPKVNYEHSESYHKAHPNQYPDYLDKILAEHDGVWIAKFGYNPDYDTRNDLTVRGYIQTASEVTWGRYADGRPVNLYRFDKIDRDQTPLISFGERFDLAKLSITQHPEWVTVNLVWSPEVAIDDFYTMSVFLFAEGRGIPTPGAQHDSYPFEGRSPTLGWEAGKYYFDSHVLSLEGLPQGTYQIGIKIYRAVNGDYSNLEILPPSRNCADEGCTYTLIQTITIE
jgi:hypothetical protein